MLTTDGIYAELMRGCQDGKAFRSVTELGRYRTKTVGEGEARSDLLLDSLEPVQSAAAVFRKLAERCPELKITYPQKVISEKESEGERNVRVTERGTDAVIEVPEDFARLHGGFDFCELLRKDWKAQTDDLIEKVVKRLRKYELRTARLFGSAYDRTQIRLRIESEEIGTDIWRLRLEKCGLLPLQWDSEICGLAQLLRDALREALQEDCDNSHVLTIIRNETEQFCVLRLTYVQME